MARANYESSDDELPALADIIARRRNASNPQTKLAQDRHELTEKPLVRKAKTCSTTTRRQRLLKPPTMHSKLAGQADPSSFGSIASLDDEDASVRRPASAVKRTPARAARKTTKYVIDSEDPEESSNGSSNGSPNRVPDESSDESSDAFFDAKEDMELNSELHSGEDVEESLWCGSDGDDSAEEASQLEEILPPNSGSRKPEAKNTKAASVPPPEAVVDGFQGFSSHSRATHDDIQHSQDPLAAPVLKKPVSAYCSSEKLSSSSSANQDAMLRYSPPRSKSPHKLPQQTERPCTPPPPASPSKSRLMSPSKKNRIPTPPHGPSLDAFWSAEVVNTWNDQHSPRKVLQSPRKQQRFGATNDGPILSSSLQKKSPTKRDPARKSFEQRKHDLANDFLKELDDTITQGRISSLAEECGGVKLVWSKTLNTTAGRANWKRETLKTQENGTTTVRDRHHASIELAEKVIDDEDRLVNVIAHEFCHLANFMISNIRDNPHGKEFKEWAKKVTKAFGHRNINVTTKHTYAIDYKYIWACIDCGHEFKRHSKSIDPAKHRCGSCKAELAQIKPAVRQKNPNKGPSEYQIFMKENFQRIRRENEGKSHKDIMEILGKEYREHKVKKATAAADSELVQVAKAIETIVLDD
ncbi:SprT-like protein [Botryosphaeria dothidea]|uniref:SprT-like protein n=1 Tax=Botryosphaeria dothidea TaxID=55169 RepID=A0A8H4N4C5_9PEZI|nr:SprT-like protein [Botryosphaeria dothidea]